MPRFDEGNRQLEIVEPVLQIAALDTTTSTGASNDPFYAALWIRDAGNNFIQYNQGLSAAVAPVTFTFTSGSPAIGNLVTSAVPGGAGMVTVQLDANGFNTPTNLATGGVEFDPLTAGDTVVSVSAPGFAPFSTDTVSVNVAP